MHLRTTALRRGYANTDVFVVDFIRLSYLSL